MNETKQRNLLRFIHAQDTGDYTPYFDEYGRPIEGVTPFNKRGGKITINN